MSPGLPWSALAEAIDRAVAAIVPQLVAWRRDLHRHPEPAWRPADGECRPVPHPRARPPDARLGTLARRRPDRDRFAGRARPADDHRPPGRHHARAGHAQLRRIKGGIRDNIIPDEIEMQGTIRTFDEAMRSEIHERVRTTAVGITQAARAGCDVCIQRGYDVTVNDAALTETMLPTLRRVAGADRVITVPKVTGSEDFSCCQQVVPGMFFFVGVTPADRDPERAEPNHSRRFVVDEVALPLGVRALAKLACDWLEAPEEARRLG